MAGILTPGTGNDFHYRGTTDSGAPAAGSFTAGDWVEDGAGGLQVCTVAGTPGTWFSLSSGSGSSSPGLNLAPTAVKTANYTAAVSDLVPVDTTSGAVTITLPTAPADKSTIAVKIVTLGAGNFVTIACGGSDVMNKTSGATTRSLKLLNEAVVLQYKASGAIWYTVATDKFQVNPLTDFPAVAGTPSSSNFLRGDGSWATPSASADASAVGYYDAVAQGGLVADAVILADGVVGSGTLSTLTSASAPFAASAAGKQIVLYQTAVIPDAVTTIGSAVVTSASNAVPAWVAPGMKIILNSAVGSFAQVMTVLTNDGVGQLTLTATAGRTTTAGPAQVLAMHSTTIATFTSTTQVELTAAAPYAFSVAAVVYGTDNRAALATAAAAAKTANKILYCPSGKYLVLPTAGNPYATGVLTSGSFFMRGAGRAATNFVIAHGAIPTFDNGLIGGGTGITIDVADFKWSYIGPPPTSAASGGGSGSVVNLARAGTAVLTIRGARIDADQTNKPWIGMRVQGGTGTADTVVDLEDCQLSTVAHAFQYFVNTGTSAKFFARRTRFESNYFTQNMTDQSGNWHVTYIHPSVALMWHSCTTKSTTPTTAAAANVFHIHLNGSPTDVPAFWSLVEHTSEGVGKFILTANNIRRQVFERCKFRHLGLAIAVSADSDIIDCEFYNNGFTAISNEATTATLVRIQGGYFGMTGSGSTPISLSQATAGVTIVKDIIWAALSGNPDFIFVPNQPLTIIIEDCIFAGIGTADICLWSGQTKLYVRRVNVSGNFTNGCFYTDVAAAGLSGYAEFDSCDFTGLSTTTDAIWDHTATGTDGNAVILPTNRFGATNTPRSDGRTGHRGMARPMLAAATIAAASTTTITWDATRFHLTSSAPTDINNIFRGGTAARNKMSADISTLRNPSANAVTLKHGTGNLTCSTGADIVLATGEAVNLYADALGGITVHKVAA